MKHSKITAIVLTLCMLVTLMVVAPTAASATTTDANLVKDGSFEAWGTTGEQDRWLWVVPGANPDKEIPASTATMELVGSEKVSGNYAVRFKATGNQNTGTHYVSQNMGKFDAGTKIKMSIMAKVVQAENVTGYLRLIGRVGGPASGSTAVAIVANPSTVASTDWKEYSIEYTVSADNATKDQYITFEISKSTDFEVYLDDFKVEVVTTKPALQNGDFESGKLDPWAPTSTGGTPTVETDEKGNHYLKLDEKRRECVRQTVNGLTPGKHYYVTFDIKTNGAHGHININPVKGTTLTGLSAYDTGGEWQRHTVEWTTASDTSARIEFRLETPEKNADGSTYVVTDEYIYIDNVVFGEIEDNALHNAGFEYGPNGMGLAANTPGLNGVALGHWAQSNSSGYTATYTLVDGGMGGKKALKVERPIADGIANTFTQIKQEKFSLTAGEKYVFTAYVKAGEDFVPVADSSAAQFFIRINNAKGADGTKKNADDYPTTKLSAANGWTPLKMVFTAHSTGDTTLQFRTYGTGTFYYSNFSIRKLNAPVIDYRRADGDISEGLVDGGKASITMPVADGDAGNVIALALYNRNGENKTLLNVKAQTITAANVTAGYASFELKADALGADFANVNYAKLIMLKGGSYDAVQEYDLLLKAAQ